MNLTEKKRKKPSDMGLCRWVRHRCGNLHVLAKALGWKYGKTWSVVTRQRDATVEEAFNICEACCVEPSVAVLRLFCEEVEE